MNEILCVCIGLTCFWIGHVTAIVSCAMKMTKEIKKKDDQIALLESIATKSMSLVNESHKEG